MLIGFFFSPADKYHDLKLTQNLSAGVTGYQRANDVVPNGEISFTLDNLAMDATVEQDHLD